MTKKRHTGRKTPEVCPICKDKIPPGALACPECGADHDSGWREDVDLYDGVDLPDDDFDYDDIVNREFGSRVRPPGLRMVWWIAGIVLIAVLILMYLYAAH